MSSPYRVPVEDLDSRVDAEETVVEVRPRYGVDPGLPLGEGGDVDGDGD